MKSIRDYINNEIVIEGTGDKFCPNIKSHADTYNKLLKWYDKAITRMNKDEAIDLLKYAIDQWEHDNFDDI